MLREDLILKSPISKIPGISNIENRRFGAVISRAGVGKTGFLVQIALTRLLSNENLIHISLYEPIEKINLRYNDAYTNLIDSIGYIDPQKALRLWEDIYPNKVVISYNENTFDTEKIRDYLKSFKKVDLALPALIIIDELDFDKDQTDILTKLYELSMEYSLFIWFSMKSHREQKFSDEGYPVQLEAYKDKFDKAVYLKPVEDKIEVLMLKNGGKTEQNLILQPSTMMAV
jgi:hypothetical protein